MYNWPKDNQYDLKKFYGTPDGTAKWEVTNLVYVFFPWTAYLAGTKTELKRGVRIHKKCAESFKKILDELWVLCGKDQKKVEALDLHQIGGTYLYRTKRGSGNLSLHAFGAAIDIDPVDNQMGRGKPSDMHPSVVAVFEKYGWKWGKAFNDPMHFEATFNGKLNAPTKREPNREIDIQYNDDAVNLVKRWESFVPTRYWDFGQWAIGYGTKADHLPANTVWTETEADSALRKKFNEIAARVYPYFKVGPTSNQAGAMISLAYNIGEGAFIGSSVLRKFNEGDFDGAAESFLLWCKARAGPVDPETGKKQLKVLPGLLKRRQAERQFFLEV